MEEQRQELELDLGTLLWNFFKGLKKTWWLIPALAVLGAVWAMEKLLVFMCLCINRQPLLQF